MSNFLSPTEIAEAYDGVSVKKARNGTGNLVILGILAGAFIAFGGFASQMVSHAINNPGLAKFAGGAVFPVGLMLVVIAGGELFTGNNLMIIGTMDRKIRVEELLRNWTIVYIANFIGAASLALLIHLSGLLDTSGGRLGAAVINTALAKVSLPFGQAFVRGILCNILVVLGVWMATAAKDVIGKIFSCWFPVMLFVTSGFEHSVANMYFITLGMFAKSNAAYLSAGQIEASALGALSVEGLLNNLIPVTLGNIVGGAVMVGLAYWYVYRYAATRVVQAEEQPYLKRTSYQVR